MTSLGAKVGNPISWVKWAKEATLAMKSSHTFLQDNRFDLWWISVWYEEAWLWGQAKLTLRGIRPIIAVLLYGVITDQSNRSLLKLRTKQEAVHTWYHQNFRGPCMDFQVCHNYAIAWLRASRNWFMKLTRSVFLFQMFWSWCVSPFWLWFQLNSQRKWSSQRFHPRYANQKAVCIDPIYSDKFGVDKLISSKLCYSKGSLDF